MQKSGDKIFLILTIILLIGGFCIFLSASLGLLSRVDESPLRLLLTQVGFGLIPGIGALIFLRFAKPALIETATPFVYVATVLATLLVFIPGVGTTLNGATRWIDIFGITTFQPAEFLKLGTILMVAYILSRRENMLASLSHTLVPFLVVILIPVGILLLQPNTSTAAIILATSLILYALSGAPWKYLYIMGIIGLTGLAVLVFSRDYLRERFLTFIDPSRDPLAGGYQLQQSLIAVGSGEFLGRGLGQSVQKFGYLPEPVGDSIFAVFSEEFGFVGATLLVLLFLFFALRALRIAGHASTRFFALAGTGLTLLIVLSAFFNMGAMLGIVPLSGVPLPLVSHGGSALFASLIGIGIILNIASHPQKKASV